MKQIDLKELRTLYDENKKNPEMALTKAKVAVSVTHPTERKNNPGIPMTDAECMAYAQAIYLTEQLRGDAERAEKNFLRDCADEYCEKFGTYDMEEEKLQTMPKYRDIAQQTENCKKNSANLFKQALLCNPDDEQLRLLCAGCLYRNENIQEAACINMLEDSDIAKDLALSTRIIDAAIQWKKAFNNSTLGQHDDFNVLAVCVGKNMTPAVMIAGASKDIEANKHPSYERGIHLLGKLEQRIQSSTLHHKAVADETIRCIGTVDSEVLRSAFENSPRFAKAYGNLEKAYREAYIREAEDMLGYSNSHEVYNLVTARKSPTNTSSHEGR